MPLADIAESWLAAHYDDLVGWRRHFHRHPELGRQEFATTQFVADRLVDAGLNPKALPGGTGLIDGEVRTVGDQRALDGGSV